MQFWATFVTFAIYGNLGQFEAISNAISEEIIRHFLYTTNLEIGAVQEYVNFLDFEK